MSRLFLCLVIGASMSGVLASHDKKAQVVTTPEPVNVPDTTPKVPDTLTPQQHLDVLNKQLPQQPHLTRGVEGLSAEGTIFSHYATRENSSKATTPTIKDGVEKVVIERKGETFDETISIYYKDAQPMYVHREYQFNAAKFMKPGDEGYDEAIKTKSTETNIWRFQASKLQTQAKKGDTARLDLERRMADHATWSLRMMHIKHGKACRWVCSGEGELCGQIGCRKPEAP